MTNLFLIWFIVTKAYFWTPFLIDGASMEPTLHSGEVVMIDRDKSLLLEGKAELKRGEIIVFAFEDNFFYVKRVIGLPGEKLKINKEGVFLKLDSGEYQLLNEPYLLGGEFNYGDERFFQVPAGKYFVLGDNRDHSKDSRYFGDPYISTENVYGRFVWEIL